MARRRTLAEMAAMAGGAVTAAGTLTVGVLLGQVLVARLTIPGAEAPAPRSTGRYGREYGDGPPLRLAVLGDSTAAGYGVRTRAETPGALLATWIAEAAQRPVHLTCPAVVGSPSAWLPGQVETAIEAGVDLAIIFIGANDVTTKVTTRANQEIAAAHLADAVRELRAAGAEVVVATCPDLGTVRPIRPPLRWLARYWSRQLAAAQTLAVLREGGRTVSLGDLLGPTFAASPQTMFGDDRFHPSAAGYRAAAEAVLPSALAALGLRPRPATSEPVPAVQAAAVAAYRPGTEVSAADVPTGDGRAAEMRSGYGRAADSRAASWLRRNVNATRSRRSMAARDGGLAVPSLTGELASPAD